MQKRVFPQAGKSEGGAWRRRVRLPMCGLSRQCGWSFEACGLPMRGADGQMPTLRTSSCSGDRCVGRRTLGRRGARGATWRVLLTFRAGERGGLSPQRAKSWRAGDPEDGLRQQGSACGALFFGTTEGVPLHVSWAGIWIGSGSFAHPSIGETWSHRWTNSVALRSR
jgi:hypothetical protein